MIIRKMRQKRRTTGIDIRIFKNACDKAVENLGYRYVLLHKICEWLEVPGWICEGL